MFQYISGYIVNRVLASLFQLISTMYLVLFKVLFTCWLFPWWRLFWFTLFCYPWTGCYFHAHVKLFNGNFHINFLLNLIFEFFITFYSLTVFKLAIRSCDSYKIKKLLINCINIPTTTNECFTKSTFKIDTNILFSL